MLGSQRYLPLSASNSESESEFGEAVSRAESFVEVNIARDASEHEFSLSDNLSQECGVASPRMDMGGVQEKLVDFSPEEFSDADLNVIATRFDTLKTVIERASVAFTNSVFILEQSPFGDDHPEKLAVRNQEKYLLIRRENAYAVGFRDKHGRYVQRPVRSTRRTRDFAQYLSDNDQVKLQSLVEKEISDHKGCLLDRVSDEDANDVLREWNRTLGVEVDDHASLSDQEVRDNPRLAANLSDYFACKIVISNSDEEDQTISIDNKRLVTSKQSIVFQRTQASQEGQYHWFIHFVSVNIVYERKEVRTSAFIQTLNEIVQANPNRDAFHITDTATLKKTQSIIESFGAKVFSGRGSALLSVRAAILVQDIIFLRYKRRLYHEAQLFFVRSWDDFFKRNTRLFGRDYYTFKKGRISDFRNKFNQLLASLGAELQASHLEKIDKSGLVKREKIEKVVAQYKEDYSLVSLDCAADQLKALRIRAKKVFFSSLLADYAKIFVSELKILESKISNMRESSELTKFIKPRLDMLGNQLVHQKEVLSEIERVIFNRRMLMILSLDSEGHDTAPQRDLIERDSIDIYSYQRWYQRLVWHGINV